MLSLVVLNFKANLTPFTFFSQKGTLKLFYNKQIIKSSKIKFKKCKYQYLKIHIPKFNFYSNIMLFVIQEFRYLKISSALLRRNVRFIIKKKEKELFPSLKVTTRV